MSAQPADAKKLCDDERQLPEERLGSEEVETAAVSSGATVPVVSEAPQMNGVGCGGGGGNLEGAEAHGSGLAETVTAEDQPRGSGQMGTVDVDAAQRMQARTDNNYQAVTSGAIPAVSASDRAFFHASSGSVDVSSGIYMTPRSTRSVQAMAEGARPSSHAWPGWITRLGDLFKAPPVTWLPSPMPSPPRPRRLLDPRNARVPPPPARSSARPGDVMGFRVEEPRGFNQGHMHNTPSSSSLPTEAIQAEVQRQLGGLLERLQAAEAVNARFQEELEVARNQGGAACGYRDNDQAMQAQQYIPLLPRDEPQDVLGGATEPVREPLQEPRGDQGRRGDDVQGDRPRPSLWHDPLGALWEDLQSRRAGEREGQGHNPEVPRPDRADGTQEGAGGGGTQAILEALTKNLVSLQEMQVQSMKRDREGEDTPEQVKSGTLALPMLAGPDDPSAGILFQDWLTQVSIPMQDLSASSSTWWKLVMQLVQTTYNAWLSSTPLERLQLEPRGHEALTTARWTRVNSRACTLVLQALVDAVRTDLISRRAVQSMPVILFRLHTCYQPGGASERSAVLGNLQNLVQPHSIEASLEWLRSWPRWVQRCKDLNMMAPDGSVLARALTSATSRFVSDNADVQFRTQLLRSSLRIDAQPSLTDVTKYQQHLQAEVESLMAAKAVQSGGHPAVKGDHVGYLIYYNPSRGIQASLQIFCEILSSGCRRGQGTEVPLPA